MAVGSRISTKSRQAKVVRVIHTLACDQKPLQNAWGGDVNGEYAAYDGPNKG